MESVVVHSVAKLAECLVAPVVRPCGYAIFYDRNVQELSNEVHRLDDAMKMVLHRVEEAQMLGKPIRSEVEEWIIDGRTVTRRAHDLLRGATRRPPNPKLRYRFSRKARKIVNQIRVLIERSNSALPGLVASAPEGNFSAIDQGGTIIKSRASILAEIMHALDDEKVRVIGVCGPLGVGKTMLLEEVEKKLRNESRLFHMIATANISQTPDLKKIQDDIACALSLNLNDVQSESRRRDLLLQRLQKDPSEKVLIILDNLWNELDLRRVGIPSGDESKGCKLLLISRYNNVLQQMCADQTFHLEDDKAFGQFEETVSNRLQDDEKLKAKAPQMEEELPGTFDESYQLEPLHQAEEIERSSIEIESSPPKYSRKVLMRGGLGLMEPVEVTQWQSFTEIYLMNNKLAELPENPRCPGLLVLFLNRNCKLRTISPPFFDFMPALEILNLSRTRIKSLPESLFRLSRLKRLFLNHCELLRVLPPEVGELQQLEVLDLEGTKIMDLPKEVAKLTKLTCLEVSFCPSTTCGTKSAEANALIPPGTISALSQLEELSIDTHPEDEGWESVVEAIVDDVCGLMRLDTLKLYFPQVEHLRKWFGTSKVSRSLSHFKFIVGKHAERIMGYLPKDLEFEFEYWDRSLKYVNGVGVPIDILKMLQYTTAFFLDRHRDVAKLSDFGIENMEQLKCCIIGECKEIKVIVDGTDAYDEANRSKIVSETQEDGRRFLGSLEYLYIYRMKSLSCIYEGPLHRGSFSHLKCLAFLTCPQLTSIFTPGLLENLDRLEELNVDDCPLVLSLVSCKDTSIYESTCFLPKLKKISLVSLPGLISISSGLRIAPNLERWSIIDCPNLESTSADEICCGPLTGPRGTFDKSCQFEPPHQAEELERSSIEIESSPPEYSGKVLMRRGLGLTEPPEVTRWQSFTEIYLMENELAELPENPRCPGLLVLFLNRNCKLRTISPLFFDFMPALEILNLSRTWIKSLPESLFRLSRLKRLFLNHCELLRVLPPKVGELQQLEVLDLEGTEIMDLPKEVAKLTKLTCLEVSFCPRTNCGTKSAEASALIPPGTISALSQLEELSIDTHPEDERWESVVEAIVDDVCGLVRLDTLKLYFPQVEHLRKWLGTSKVSRSLSHFKFVVGKHAERIMDYLPEDLEFELEHWDRSLKYVNGVGVPIDIQNMLLQTTAFFLDHHRDVAKFSDFGIENMEQLRCCIIGECDEIEVIVDGTDVYDEADRNEIVLETREDDRSFLGSLEYLYVYRMKSLLSIYVGPLHRGSLSRLKCLALLTCPQLTSLFTPGLMENLGSLEELHVEDCPLLLSLVRCEDTHIYESTNFLPKLKKISLFSLPELISISNGLCIAPNLERLSIIGCPNLKSPSADESCRSNLKSPSADESCRSNLTGPRVMVEAAASAIAVEAYKDGRGIFGYLSKKVDYADDFKVNFEKMTDQAKMLYARRDDVEAEINKNKMKRVTKECAAWINRVKVAEQEVLKLESKYKKEIAHAWRYAWLWSRANISRHMANKREELRVLLEEGKLDNGVVAERSPEHVRVIDTCRIEDKPSLNWAVEEILGNLRERKIKRVGLWGMVGTGKTTVMQNLNNDKEVKKMFDIVIWVSVSKAWSIEKVQDAITQCLKLRLEGGANAVETAQLISNELGGMRYLLLLDEVWDPFDLHEIGIPNNDNDSKVVFASRFRDLCYDMDADQLVNMKRLSDADAYKMFEEKVGRSMTNPSIIPVAQLVVRECAGLPLLIDRVARVFRKKDSIHLWRDGLKSLQRWPSIKIQGMDEVLEFLKFCYEDLDGQDKKVCFLYGALFPEDRDIFVDYLMECWKAEGFLDSIDEFRDARDRGHSILHDLINVSLFERSAMKTHVRMNRIVRKMALKILSGISDHKILARPCEGLKQPPKEEEWTSASRISLMDNDLCSLPATSNCTNLLTLLLQRNKNLMMIPESFFLSMQRLRVLDLHATAITSLPPSLPCLTHLRALYLNSCKGLIELPSSLEALVHLEVLDIRHTGIISLPIQVGSLPQMRCLRMSLSNFGAGNPKVISSISLLEELMIDVDPNTLWSDQVMRTITEEVSTLTRLTSLTFSFPKVEFLEIFVRSSPLWKDLRFTFQFLVGICNSVKHHILDYFECQSCKCLKYANDEGAHPVISEVLTETEVFELIDHKNILSLSAFGTENLSKLRACSVEGCEDIICIIDGNVAPPCAFEWLERMVINRAPNLHCIWKGPVPVGSLGQMTSLTLYNCPKLKKIFSYGLIQQLSELKHLSVEGCHEIEEIIIETKNSCLDPRTLPSLKKLVVHDLPKLRSIAPNDTLIWPSLERLDIVSCPSLLKLPFTGINAINLRSIVAEQSWWSTLVWQDDAIEERLRSFCSFI